jgi:murein DD-endopeptidase MepM/ murein hydrolase activator NlpD
MPRRRRPAPVALLAAATAVAGGAVAALAPRAGAQILTPTTASTTTTAAPTTTEPSTTPTTGAPLTLPGSSTTTTAPAPSTTSTTGGPADGGGGGEGAPAPGKAKPTVPPGAQQQIDGYVRSGPNSTAALEQALQPLVDLGMAPTQALIVGAGQFPVAGRASFVDDWWFPRYYPTFHLHQGTDIFAAWGTPVRAPFDGVLKQTNGDVGGMASYVTAADGTYSYAAHLSAWFPGQANGTVVHQGDVIGFVGNTGDARGGPYHCHFEVHPGGGPAVNPYPLLRIVDDAQKQIAAGQPQGAVGSKS